MKKILITGASGFIGSFFVEEALKRNFEVYAGVRKSSSRKYLSNSAIHFLELDFNDKKGLKNILKNSIRFDYVIHAAGVIKTCHKDDFKTINYQYTKNFIEALQETDKVPDKFLFISSLAAFGSGNENTLQPISITDTPHPVTLYGKSKLMAEQYIQSLSDFPYLILRPTGVYGPREKDYYLAYKSIKLHIESYIGTKEQHLTFLYVTDFAKLVFNALESEIIGKAYFVTDLKQYTAQEFNTIIKKTLNKKAIAIVFPKAIVKPIVIINEKISCLFGKPVTLNSDKYNELICKNWLCESAEIIKDFDFQPEYDLKKGVRKAIEWFKNEKLL
ncbi:MAG: NAD(P)-dependent oxidoreductase [Bacteroidetes bacterium]|nr:MAG: NAD(P)-dependent oxidoreductase [Bacteroidota bacterium]